MTKPTNDEIATFTLRNSRVLEGFLSGRLPAPLVNDALQRIFEGQFPNPTTLAEMIKAGHYDWTNNDITEKNFPVNPERFTTANVKVYHFKKVMSTEAVVAKMAKDGYEPAFIENLLAYGAENPEDQRKHPIIALGSSCVHRSGNRCSPCLGRGGAVRVLSLRWLGYDWRESYRFLAVRKSAL